MNRTTRHRTGPITLACIALTMLALTLPVRAHETKHRGDKHRQHARHGHRVDRIHPPGHGWIGHRQSRHLHAPHRAVYVPREIFRAERARYRSYYRGAVWYRPHRHTHAVYYFPVRGEFGVAYRPHHYCEGQLYVDSHIGFQGSRVSFDIRF